ELLARVHTGYNGDLITGDPEKLAEAKRFYTGREVLKPMLFIGAPPNVGAVVMIPQGGIRVADNGRTQIALNNAGAVSGAVSVGMNSSMAAAVSTASQGATSGGVSAVAATVGGTAGVGASGGGSTQTGNGAGPGASQGAGPGAGPSGGGMGGAGGGAGAFNEYQINGTQVVSISYDIDGQKL
ncbi:MAG: hypothetical protein HQL43_09745, partial [Alphaproteobacteria bacterium]|nr:hypothetical protein [Alphaproteobacteria bacterium]